MVLIHLVLFAFVVCGTAFAQARYDVVIQGGRVLDPETSLDAVRDVGIRGNQIAAMSEQPLVGTRVITPWVSSLLPASSISTITTRPLRGTA